MDNFQLGNNTFYIKSDFGREGFSQEDHFRKNTLSAKGVFGKIEFTFSISYIPKISLCNDSNSMQGGWGR